MKDLTDTEIYLINLKDRPDRLKNFMAQDALAAMPPINHIHGIKGADIHTRKDKRIGLKTRVHVLTEYRRSHYEIHSKGALGASFSHIKTWQAFLDSKKPYALVLEDDAELPSTFAVRVKDCAKLLPAEWDIWILGWNFQPHDATKVLDSNSSFRNILHFLGAHSYIVTRKAAKILLEEALPIETHVENFICNTALIHDLKIIRIPEMEVKQMDRIKNVSDVRKPTGCPTCVVDDKKDEMYARENNSSE